MNPMVQSLFSDNIPTLQTIITSLVKLLRLFKSDLISKASLMATFQHNYFMLKLCRLISLFSIEQKKSHLEKQKNGKTFQHIVIDKDRLYRIA